ncbi:MAG: serine hydrolase [Saprospiraceae bacterium]|nr:serine hydrolase [Saprospiraceae bacterium]
MKLIVSLLIILCTSISMIAQIDISTVNQTKFPRLDLLDSLVLSGKYENITSILVAKNGRLLFEKYYNGHDINSKHNTRSVTKTMATFLTGIAIDQGYVQSEKDKIFKYLQHKLPILNPDKRKEDITIEDLLTMSSVLECDDSNWHSRGHEERMYFIEDWTKFLLDLPVRSYPFGPRPENAPYGRVFAYAFAKAAAVADILQNAIKSDLVQFMEDHLFKPLNITDYTIHKTPQNILNTAGGSEYKSRDFLKLIQLFANNGKWENTQIISSAWIKKATSPKVNAYEGVDYGYFLWLKKFGQDVLYPSYYMSGNGGNKVLVIPSLDISLVITTTNYNNRNAHNYTDEMVSNYIIPSLED